MVLGDETEIVFLNASGVKGDVSEALKEFLSFLKNGVATTELCREIDTAVDMAKEHKEWRLEYMTLMMRDKEKIKEGEEKTILRLVSNGKLTLEEGAEELSCTVEEIIKLMAEKGYKVSVCS